MRVLTLLFFPLTVKAGVGQQWKPWPWPYLPLAPGGVDCPSSYFLITLFQSMWPSWNQPSQTSLPVWVSCTGCYLIIIVRSFQICQASLVTNNWNYPCAEIRAVMNLKLSVLLVRTIKTYTLKILILITYLILEQEYSEFLVTLLAQSVRLLDYFLNFRLI